MIAASLGVLAEQVGCGAVPGRRSGRRPFRASLLLLAGLALAGCTRAPKDRIALIGATVIDGSGGEPQSDVVVLVHGSKIESIEPRAGFKLPKTAVAVDVSGKFIIPGLIDAHAHVARWALTRYLAYGVTTVRDLHGNQDSILGLKEQAGRSAIVSPRIYSAGAMIDGDPPTYPDATVVKTEDEARRAVDARVVAGVDYLKTYTRITPTLLKAVLGEAANFHVPVAAHLGLTDALTASRMGVRSIEHLTGIPEAIVKKPEAIYAAHRQSFFAGWTAFEHSWATLDSASLYALADQLAKNGVTMVPTLTVHETFSRLDDPATYQSQDLKIIPDSEMQRWNVPGMIARAGWKAADYDAFRKARPVQDLFLRAFRSAGGTIVTGTDAINQLLVPGASEHTELALLVDAGLTPGDALLAATHNGAVLLGADSIGMLLPGKAADLVVLGADPLADIANTRRVEQVMVRGLLLKADSLRSHW
ncbi:MAG TPA: amidohydrolase family protein [Gemmatimonadales bacterium]|nr:amidohydrolase family protein [Gemmatimonadales bacterium]